MSFPHTPNNKTKKTPANTPGWTLGLFGMFSTAKKTPAAPSVDASTNITPRMNGDVIKSDGKSMSDNSAGGAEPEEFYSPIAPLFSVGGSPTKGGKMKTSRLEVSALSSRKNQYTFLTNASGSSAPTQLALYGDGEQSGFRINNKSPSQNQLTLSRSTYAEPTFGQGIRSRASQKQPGSAIVRSFKSNSTSDRTRRYRPSSNLLTGSKGGRRYRQQGKLDESKFGRALAEVKDIFVPFDAQHTSTNVYSTKGAMRWGSSTHRSRIPNPVQKRQRDEQIPSANEEDYDCTSRKRHKKVSFEEEAAVGDAIMTSISATQHSGKDGPSRKATPMPKKNGGPTDPLDNKDEENGDDDVDAPSLKRKIFLQRKEPPLPQAPPRPTFNTLSLDVDGPVPFYFHQHSRKSYDLSPDPEAREMMFKIELKTKLDGSASVSNTCASEFEESRYARPSSPTSSRTKTQDVNEGDAVEHATKRQKIDKTQDEVTTPDWECSVCKTINGHDESRCLKEGCGNSRSIQGVSAGWGDLVARLNKGKWKCAFCDGYVEEKYNACQSCKTKRGAAKPDSEAHPAPANANPTPLVDNSKTASSETKSFQFGGPTPNLPVPTGLPTPAAGFTFAAPAVANTTPIGFNFGGSGSAPAPGGSATEGFAFVAHIDSSKEAEKSKLAGFVASKAATAGTTEPARGFFFGTNPVPKPTDKGPLENVPTAANVDGKSKGTPSAPTVSDDAKTSAFSVKTFGENGDKDHHQSNFVASGKASPEVSFKGSAETKPSTLSTSLTFASTESTELASPKEKSKCLADPPAAFAFGQDNGKANANSGFQFGAFGNDQKASTGNFSFGSITVPSTASESGGLTFGRTNALSAPSTLKGEQSPKHLRGYELNGAKPNSMLTSTSGQNLFGASSDDPPDGAPFKFGTTAPTNVIPTAPGNAFGIAGLTPSSGIQFGAGHGPGTGGFSFGTSSSQTPAPAAFGTVAGAPTPVPGFGSAMPVALFGGTPAAPPAPAPGFCLIPGAQQGSIGFGTTPAPASTVFGSTSAPSSTGFGPAPSSTMEPPTTPGVAFGVAPGGFGAAKPLASTPGSSFFGAQTNQPPSSFGVASFVSQTPVAGFNGSAFGSSNIAAPSGSFSTPAPPAAFGPSGFGVPQTVPAGGISGSGFGQSAPTTGGFSIGSSDAKPRRRLIRAKRPTRT